MSSENPVSTAVRAYIAKSEAAERLDALILAFEIILRTDVCLLATLFLRSECRSLKVQDLLLTNSRRFTLGVWLELLQALVLAVPREFARGLIDWVHKMSEGNILRELLVLRNQRAHDESRIEKVETLLARAEPLFRRCLEFHPNLGEVSHIGNGRLEIDIEGVPFPGGLFLICGGVVGHPDTVLLYRGTGHDVVEYGSLGGYTHTCPLAYLELLEHLREKETRLDTLGGGQARYAAKARLTQHTQETLKRLANINRYRPGITIERPELDLNLEAFLESGHFLMIVQGPSGSGKTVWLCNVAERRLQRGKAVLFETADRLDTTPLPEGLGKILRVKDFMLAIEAAADQSGDGKALVALDALETLGREVEFFSSLFHWVERLKNPSRIKILTTISSERWWLFSDGHETAIPREMVLEYSMPSLNLYSLQELARKLPKVGIEAQEIEAARLETARRISSLAYDSSLQPGLAVAILEAVESSTASSTFSAARVYEELFRRIVMKVVDAPRDQPWRAAPRQPWSARILRGVAAILLSRAADRIALEDEDVEHLHLIEPTIQQRSAVYVGLLADRILAEVLEGLTSYIFFTDQRFFEFVASLTLSEINRTQVLADLYEKWRKYPPALAVAAFYLTRIIRASGTVETVRAVQEVQGWLEPLLMELASVEGEAFLDVFKVLALDRPERALALLNRLTERGESRLTARAAEILIENLTQGSEFEMRARFLKARALYEVDNYRAAEEEVEKLGDRFPCYCLRAEISLSRGHLNKALQDYEAVLREPDLGPEERADILGGIGYIRYRFGNMEAAESSLREALSLLGLNETALLAETIGDLGQVLMSSGRLDLARECFAQDLAICKNIGHLMGVSVAESLLARLNFLQGRVEEAEAGFLAALRIARQTGNRWREAWILKGFAELCHSLQRSDEAEMYERDAMAICNEIGIVTL